MGCVRPTVSMLCKPAVAGLRAVLGVVVVETHLATGDFPLQGTSLPVAGCKLVADAAEGVLTVVIQPHAILRVVKGGGRHDKVAVGRAR